MNILGLDTSIVSENLTVCTVRDPIIACVSASLLAAREGGGRKSHRTGRRPPATGSEPKSGRRDIGIANRREDFRIIG